MKINTQLLLLIFFCSQSEEWYHRVVIFFNDLAVIRIRKQKKKAEHSFLSILIIFSHTLSSFDHLNLWKQSNINFDRKKKPQWHSRFPFRSISSTSTISSSRGSPWWRSSRDRVEQKTRTSIFSVSIYGKEDLQQVAWRAYEATWRAFQFSIAWLFASCWRDAAPGRLINASACCR